MNAWKRRVSSLSSRRRDFDKQNEYMNLVTIEHDMMVSVNNMCEQYGVLL
jgi:hypothetical protein